VSGEVLPIPYRRPCSSGCCCGMAPSFFRSWSERP
jgi:hypothetical protein